MRVQVGKVGRPHGLEGAFVVEDASDDPDRFLVGGELLVDGEPARIVESKRAGGRPVIRFDRDVSRGAPLEVERSELPEPGEGEYYAFQLVGLEVEEAGGRKLGSVTEVTSGPANDVLELDTGLALPLVDACVQEVDLDAGRILVQPGFSADS
ncbi:MAG TPA: ribosome maturation factor RimM [Gaiellaceae bacterium]|nr:ribosome maturation factor RimM [Gaiellaceae bacterium]